MAVRRVATAPNASDYVDPDTDVMKDEDETDTSPRSSMVQSGWAAARKEIESNSRGFTDEFRFSEEPRLVKFLSAEPIASYRQHWLDGKAGRKSYSCLESVGEKCPLCEILGDRPDTKIAFSILTLDGESPKSEALVVGPRLAGSLEKLHDDPRLGPLDKHFWSLSRSGKGAKTQHTVNPVKERDLVEDWDLDPDKVRAAIATSAPLDESFVRFETRDELREIAKELAG